MNKVVAILLCFCLSCQCVLKLSIFAWFELNREYIAATLCENKDRPELVCCGKCVLTKHLAKADGLEKNNPKQQAPKLDKTEVTAFILPAVSHTVSETVFPTVTPRNGTVKTIPFSSYTGSIFHPPATA